MAFLGYRLGRTSPRPGACDCKTSASHWLKKVVLALLCPRPRPNAPWGSWAPVGRGAARIALARATSDSLRPDFFLCPLREGMGGQQSAETAVGMRPEQAALDMPTTMSCSLSVTRRGKSGAPSSHRSTWTSQNTCVHAMQDESKQVPHKFVPGQIRR